MQDLLTHILPFFGLVVMGYGAARYSVLNAAAIQGLSRFVYLFALPSLLFSKIAATPIDTILDEKIFVLGYLIVGLGLFALMWGVAKYFFRHDTAEVAVMSLAGCYGNIGFLGIPLLVGILGSGAAAPLSIMLLLDVALFIPLATTLMELSRHGTQGGVVLRKALAGVAKNPLILAIVAGLLMSASGLGLPAMVGGFTNLLGLAAGPGAMFALGAVLAGRPLSEGMADAISISVFKLFLHPFVMWFVMGALGVSPEWRMIATLGAATPVAAALFVIAQEHNAMARRASTSIMVSTALSMISLPMIIRWLNG